MSEIVHFLASGQSNMVGNTRAIDATINPNIEIWNPATGAWEIARISEELDPVTGMHTGGSMAFAAAQAYQERHGGTVRLIIDTEGGRPLDDWLIADKHANDGVRYDSLTAQYEAAGSPDIDMFLFAQGEANRDAASQNRTTINTAIEYQVGLLTFFDQLMQDRVLSHDSWIMMPELIKVAGSESYDRNDVISDLETIGLSMLRTLETDHTNTDLVRTDAVHWTTDGLRDVGTRAIDLMDSLNDTGPTMAKAQSTDDKYDGDIQVSYLASTERVAVNLSTGNGALGLAENDSFVQVSGIVGSRYEDYLMGGRHDDRFWGDKSSDKIFGEGGDDILFGGGSGDWIEGGTGSDQLFGGNGRDKLNGGRLDDILTGGQGRDVFIFTQNSGDDVISDFVAGVDKIDISAFHKITGGDIDVIWARTGEFKDDIDTRIKVDDIEILLWGVSKAELSADDFIL